MCDTVDSIVNVVANVATGGLYSLVKAGINTVETGNPSALLTQGLDLGMASTGNNLATDLGGPIAGNAFNAAGGLLGAAGELASGADAALQGGANATLQGGGDASLAGAEQTGGASQFVQSTLPTASPGAGNFPSMSLDPTASLPGESPTNALTMGGTAPSSVDPLAAQQSMTSGLTPQTVTQTDPMLPGAQATDLITPSSTAMPGAQAGANPLTPEQVASLKTEDTASWWSKLPPSAQAGLVAMGTLAGGQMLTGAMGGVFQGLTAQKQLELQQLINSQNQTQRQYLNQNNQFAPALKFNSVPGPAGVAPVGIINK